MWWCVFWLFGSEFGHGWSHTDPTTAILQVMGSLSQAGQQMAAAAAAMRGASQLHEMEPEFFTR